MHGPLSSLAAIEIADIGTGPFARMPLADMGAPALDPEGACHGLHLGDQIVPTHFPDCRKESAS